jgi:DNA-binding NarL/FixJ family response regulator
MNKKFDKKLSPRQREIAKLLAQGLSNREIAEKTGLSESTVKHNNETIFLKIGAENRTQAAIIILGAT